MRLEVKYLLNENPPLNMGTQSDADKAQYKLASYAEGLFRVVAVNSNTVTYICDGLKNRVLKHGVEKALAEENCQRHAPPEIIR